MQTGDRDQTGGAVPTTPGEPADPRAAHRPPTWQAPEGGYPTPPAAPLPPAVAVRRARTGQVVLVAFLAELVITALAGNTAIATHLENYVRAHTSSFSGRFAYSVLYLAWRFSPVKSDHQHILLSQLSGLLALFVVTALIILVTVRGPVRFARAFVTIWMAVLVGAVVAGVVRRIVVDGFGQRGVGRFTDAVFSPLSSFDIVLGIALGFVVGLVAGLVATSTQRLTGTPIDPAVAGGAIPSYGAFDEPPPSAERRDPARHAAPAAEPPPEDFTTARRSGPDQRGPSGASEADRTTVLPKHADGERPGAADQTTQLPRPGDERG